MFVKSDRYTIQKDIQIFDGRNIQLATGTGTKIGTAPGQKIGFFGHSPIIQAAAVSIPTITGSAQDGLARQAVSDINNVIKNLGLTA